MPQERKVRRYTAFFPGWATAFGAHEKVEDQENGLEWLFGQDQVGLILRPELKDVLYPAFLGGGHGEVVGLHLTSGNLRVGNWELRFRAEGNRVFDTVMELLRRPDELHFFQSYHLVYPSGTRILTLGPNAPLPLIYREIAPLLVQLD
jgi:hypothetical protein